MGGTITPTMHSIGRSVVITASFFLSATSETSSRRIGDFSFEYIFRRSECLQGYASDSNNEGLFGDLVINTSSVTCKGLGIEAKPNNRVDERVVSALDSSRFVAEMDEGSGFTFEIWATFQDFSECPMCHSRHVASIGSANEDLVGEACSTTSNVLFLQTNQSVAMKERTSLPDLTCNTLESRPSAVEWGFPVHAVFTTNATSRGVLTSTSEEDFRTACWYMNGMLAGCDVVIEPASQWHNEFYLQVLNDAVAVRSLDSTYAAPAGVVFLLAMYNRVLDHTEIMNNYDAGLQNSPPVAEDVVATINEDGELGDHYDTPALYLQNPMVSPLNLSIIYLLATDIDQQDGFPGFDVAERVLSDVYIASLPSRGTLYDVDGHLIDHVPHFVPYDGGYPVRYRPEKDDFSGPLDLYTSFSYNAVDGVTGETSVVPGVVEIHVLPKNDPPVPGNVSARIQTGETLLFLSGTDVDSTGGDAIVGFLIVDLPTHGVLYQVFDNLTRSLEAVKCGDTLLGQFVSYTYTGNISRRVDGSSEEMLVGDRISYRLYDTLGAFSTLGVASLAITSRLKAVTPQSQNDDSWICVEDTESLINLYAQDTAESYRELTIIFTAVPQWGSLLPTEANSSTLEPGDALGISCSELPSCVASVRYRPARDYFNSPTSKWNGDDMRVTGETEFFSFYVVAHDNGEYSNEVLQQIQVTNVNDPSELQCPTHPQHVRPVGTSRYSGDADFVPLDRIPIRGFSISDPDNGVDIVQVKISTRFGLLTLNTEYNNMLDFNSVSYCYEAEVSRCVGSGTSNHDLVFFAEPSYAEMALDGMSYQSLVSNVWDSINITILDGGNDSCLGQGDFQRSSSGHRCWQASCHFYIVVGGHDNPLDPVLNSGMSAQVGVSIIVGLCVLFCSCFVPCLKHNRRFIGGGRVALS